MVKRSAARGAPTTQPSASTTRFTVKNPTAAAPPTRHNNVHASD
jgi:hypothetical protein